MSQQPWTPEQTKALVRMWNVDELSMGEIAILMDTTRSRVAGRLRRIGLMGNRGGKYRLTNPASVRPEPPSLPAVACEDIEFDLDLHKDLFGLTDATCKWPHGEPGHPDFYFCGTKPIAGKPYCVAHCKVAYRMEAI